MLENIGKHYIIDGKVRNSSEYIKKEYTNRVYEVVRIVNGDPLFLEDHFNRLKLSAKLVSKSLPINYVQLVQDIARLIETEDILNNNIMIIAYYNEKKSWYIIYFRKSLYPCIDMYKNGVDTGLFKLERNTPNAKILNLEYRNSVTEEIKKRKVFEVLLVDSKGNISEGSKTNVFFYKNNIFYTAPAEQILMGITRKYVIKIIIDSGFEVKERPILSEEIEQFQGAFLTGTSIGVLPIRQIEDFTFNVSNNSQIIKIHKAYKNFVGQSFTKCK